MFVPSAKLQRKHHDSNESRFQNGNQRNGASSEHAERNQTHTIKFKTRFNILGNEKQQKTGSHCGDRDGRML